MLDAAEMNRRACATARLDAAFDAAQQRQRENSTTLEQRLRKLALGLLSPWKDPLITEAAMFQQLSFDECESVVLVTIHSGQVVVSMQERTPQAMSPPSSHPYHNILAELAEHVAPAHPDLSVEFLLNLKDDPVTKAGRRQAPVLGFCRTFETPTEVPIPHYYVRPDRLCEEVALPPPWAERRREIIGRWAYFCKGLAWSTLRCSASESGQSTVHQHYQPRPGAVHAAAALLQDALRAKRLASQPRPCYKYCQRTFFGLAGRNASLVRASTVKWDVGPTNAVRSDFHGYNASIKAKLYVPLADFASRRYSLVTDGFVAGGKLSQLLALGGVVLKPRSRFEQYYELLAIPYVHYVPLWEATDGSDEWDVADKLRWLEEHPEAAQAIAAGGRHLACTGLTRAARVRFWAILLSELARTLAYPVTWELMNRRLAGGRWRPGGGGGGVPAIAAAGQAPSALTQRFNLSAARFDCPVGTPDYDRSSVTKASMPPAGCGHGEFRRFTNREALLRSHCPVYLGCATLPTEAARIGFSIIASTDMGAS